MFTARTTGVSNPFCAPSLHPSLSDPYSQNAFAIVSLIEINTFYRYLNHTFCVFRSLVIQYLLHALYLRYRISQETCKTSYECFRLNNCGATWTAGITAAAGTGLAQSLFICLFTTNKSFSRRNTLVYFITLSSIVKFPRLLHPVELGIVSQIPSQGLSAKSPY